MNGEQRFTYQPNFTKIFFVLLIFCAASLLLIFIDKNSRSILGREVLYGYTVINCIGFLCLAMTFMSAMFVVLLKLAGKKYIILTKNTLFVPRGLLYSTICEIRLNDIVAVKHVKISNHKHIRIEHKSGVIDLPFSMFANKSYFDKTYNAIFSAKQAA